MKAIEKISQKKGLIVLLSLLLTSSIGKANGLTNVMNTIYNDLFGSNPIGFYIIGGILTFGIIAYLVESYIESKQPKVEEPTNVRHITNVKEHHYGHHHNQQMHRNVKKSA